MCPSPVPPTPVSQRTFIIFCGLLMSLSAFSIDISLPFFQSMSRGLNAPLASMPMVVTVFIFFVGVGQLVFGPLSDKLGRKPVIMLGLSLVIFGGIVAGLANTLPGVLVGRGLQGFGASAVTVLSRAMLRDSFEGDELARSMAFATGIFSIGPIVAPLVGAIFLMLGASWRFMFVGMIAYASVLMYLLLKVPETLDTPDPNAIRFVTLKRNLVAVVTHPQSRFFLPVNAIAMVSMILIIATMAPLYANVFGIEGAAFAPYFASHASGIIIGQIANHRLIARFGTVPTAILAAGVMVLAGLLIMLVQVLGLMGPIMMSALVSLFAVGFLSVIANTTSMVLQPHGRIAGFASSLQGSCSMLISALAGTAISGFVQQNVVLWGAVLTIIPTLVAVLMVYWQLKTRPQPG